MQRAAHLGLLIAGTAGLVLNGAGQSVFGPALPGYMRDFGLTEAGAGLLISVFWIGALLSVLTLIVWPGRMTARLAFASLACGAGLIAWEASWAMVLAGAATFGLGNGAIAVIYNRRFLSEFGARGASMVGLLNAIYCIGAIGGPLMFVALSSEPQRSYLIVAILAALFVPFARQGPAEAIHAGAPTPFRPGLMLLGVAAIGFEAAMIGLGPTALVAQGVGEVQAAQCASLFFVAYLAARVASIWLAPLLPPFTVFVVSLALSGIGALAASVSHPGLFYVLSGVAVALIFPAIFVFATRALGPGPRTAPTVMAACLVGGVTMPSLAAPAMAASGADAFTVMAVLALVTAALAVLCRESLTRQPSVPV